MRLLVFLFLFGALCSCQKSDKDEKTATCDIQAAYTVNAGKVTITQGVWGTVSRMQGNCMPIVGPGSTCTHCTYARPLRFYAYTTSAQATQVPGQPSFFTQFSTQLIREVMPDSEGFYQTDLPPGQYTMAILESNGTLYANGRDAQGGINSVTVTAGVQKRDFLSTWGAVF